MFQTEIEVATKGRGTYELTARVVDAVRSSGVATGLCHVFTPHTSASVMICEIAGLDVRRDLETFMALGTWQGVFLWEHRQHGHRRRVLVTIQS